MTPVRHYCTLFDSNYLIKGVAMLRSLAIHGAPCHVHVLCMDDRAHDLLQALALENVTLIRLAEFEDDDLRRVKAERTVAEYCWTCAPCLPVYVLERHPEVDFITYLDADLLFFSSTEPIYEEVAGASSVIVEHRFSPRFMPAIVNGRYNVQWVSFRRDPDGLETLYWWRDKCIEWCFYRHEPDRMGDQKYLDVWTTRFKGVHELQHVGAGTAPWNYANYRIREEGGQVRVDDVPLIFYHFHSYRLLEGGRSVPMPSSYLQDAPFPEPIYRRYDEALRQALEAIRQVEPAFGAGIEREADKPLGVPTTRGAEAAAQVARPVTRLLRRLVPQALRGRRG